MSKVKVTIPPFLSSGAVTAGNRVVLPLQRADGNCRGPGARRGGRRWQLGPGGGKKPRGQSEPPRRTEGTEEETQRPLVGGARPLRGQARPLGPSPRRSSRAIRAHRGAGDAAGRSPLVAPRKGLRATARASTAHRRRRLNSKNTND